MINYNRLNKAAKDRDIVQKKINDLIGSDQKLDASKYDIALLTATPEEFESIKSCLDNVTELDHNSNDSIIYFQGQLQGKKKELSVLLPYPQGMGISAATSLTEKALSFNPKYVFMVGIAAGNKNRTKIGDVLVAAKSINYDEVVEIKKKDKEGIKKFMQNADSINSHLKSKFSLFSKTSFFGNLKNGYSKQQLIPDDPKCVIGLLATGSSLIRSQEKVEEINVSYHDVIGLDMETYGVYYSCSHSKKKEQPVFVSIKAVSDHGDNSNHKLSANERKKYALYTSSKTLVQFVEHYVE